MYLEGRERGKVGMEGGGGVRGRDGRLLIFEPLWEHLSAANKHYV